MTDVDKLFEWLGFVKNKSECYNNHHILYEKLVMNDTDILSLEFKEGHVLFSDSLNRCIWMDARLLKAIYYKLEELRWI